MYEFSVYKSSEMDEFRVGGKASCRRNCNAWIGIRRREQKSAQEKKKKKKEKEEEEILF